MRLGPRGALAALVALTLVRLAVAAAAPLSPDEAYYWVWSRALAPGYLDHPPMVALWIRAGTAIAGPGAIGVRLLAPLAAALGSVLLAAAARDLVPERSGGFAAGLLAAGLMNATLLFGAGAVTMTPDTPLLFFWTVALWALARLRRSGHSAWWLAAGAATGLALCSKYTAALLPPAVGLWLLVDPAARRWLWRPEPWAGAVVAAALFVPTLLWNARHGWPSFAKQGGRLGAWNPADAARHVAELVAGQIGLATPVVFLFCTAGVWLAIRRTWRGRDLGWSLPAATAIVPALVFLQHALGDRVQANWPAIVYPGAAVAAAGLQGRFWSQLRLPAMATGLALTLAVYLQATAAPLKLPRHYDPTLSRLGGWRGLAERIEAARVQAGARFVADGSYGEAAELARLLPADAPVVGIASRWSLFALPDGRATMGDGVGLLLQSARQADPPDAAEWDSIAEIETLARERNGVVAESYHLYRVSGWRGSEPAALLPYLPF